MAFHPKDLRITLSLFPLLLLCTQELKAQQNPYSDGRPYTSTRIVCNDEGIVLRYGNGPDSCDIYGAREANVNLENGTYYLYYDGAGKDGWKSCLAVSSDLRNWKKMGAILQLGKPGSKDSKSASSPWVIKENRLWHMFYLGTPHTSPAPDRIPSFPYLTLKAVSTSLKGPWKKQYAIVPFSPTAASYYTVTASPGFIVPYHGEYLQFFSASVLDTTHQLTQRTLSIARTANLNAAWKVNKQPLFPVTEQVENSSIYFDPASKNWYLFTNHIGIDSNKTEYTDAVWVYWSKNILEWDANHKAIVLDNTNCKWSKGAIGMPSVIKMGNKLALLYDGFEGYSVGHMQRNIGLAWIPLPIQYIKE